MPIVVKVVSQDEYGKWVAGKKQDMAKLADDPNKKWELAELMDRGAKVYAANCQVCHQPNGQGIKGTFPALDGSPIVKGDKEAQLALMLNGKNVMPSWKGLSDVELAAAATFTRNSWSNKTGETIQPSDVKAARK